MGSLRGVDGGVGGELVAGFEELVTEFGRGEGRIAVSGQPLEVAVELIGERCGCGQGVEGGVGGLFEQESERGGEQVGTIGEVLIEGGS